MEFQLLQLVDMMVNKDKEAIKVSLFREAGIKVVIIMLNNQDMELGLLINKINSNKILEVMEASHRDMEALIVGLVTSK